MGKIILTQPVNGLGAAGDILDVKNGYARNYLFPRGFAITWTEAAANQVESIKQARLAHEEKDLNVAEDVANDLEKNGVVVGAQAGDSGKLFGTITTADVASAIEAADIAKLDRRQIELLQVIKSVGSYRAVAHIRNDVAAEFTVKVVRQGKKRKKK